MKNILIFILYFLIPSLALATLSSPTSVINGTPPLPEEITGSILRDSNVISDGHGDKDDTIAYKMINLSIL